MKLYLKTLRNTPCSFQPWGGHPNQRHFLLGGLEYELTKPWVTLTPPWLGGGHDPMFLHFHLCDEEGIIGYYEILSEDFDLFEIYNEQDEKIPYNIWSLQLSLLPSVRDFSQSESSNS